MRPSPTTNALTLIEVVVTASIAALALSLAMPTLSTNREQSRRQLCAINQKKIIRAYSLWGNDHSGFWPPRCAPDDGCTLATNVWILTVGGAGNLTEKQQGTAYYAGPRNTGLKIVGVPATEDDVEDYPLNDYVAPGWQFGEPFDLTHCPSDSMTVSATFNSNTEELADRGFTTGDVGSAFEFFGTSYLTNDQSRLPWKGHGDWAGSIVLAPNKLQSPNYNPDVVYRPGAYIVGMDLGTVFPQWNKFVLQLGGISLGEPVLGARWHETKGKFCTTCPPPDDAIEYFPWLNNNAFHADGHVTFSRRCRLREIGNIIPFPSAQCFVTPEWSMFPLRLAPEYLSPTLINSGCKISASDGNHCD